MALHTGEADQRAGDYYGSAVNRCARLRDAAVKIADGPRRRYPEVRSHLGEDQCLDLTGERRAVTCGPGSGLLYGR